MGQTEYVYLPFLGRRCERWKEGGKEEMKNDGTWSREGSERESRHERHRGEGEKEERERGKRKKIKR